MKKRLIDSSELTIIFKIILLLTLIFGFNDGAETFIFENWINNLFLVFILVSIIVLVHVYGIKIAAKLYGSEFRMKIWNSQKFKEAGGFTRKMLLIYNTPILNVLVTLLSNGKIYLSNVFSYDIKHEALGRQYQYLNFIDISVIIFWGLMSNIVLMWIFKIFELDLALKISFWFILFQLLPISELPGAKILAGNASFYIFSLVFFIFNIILLQVVNSFGALITSIIFSTILSTLFFFFVQYKRS